MVIYFLIFIPIQYWLIRPGVVDYAELELSSAVLAAAATALGVTQEELFSRGIVYTHIKRKTNGFGAVVLSSGSGFRGNRDADVILVAGRRSTCNHLIGRVQVLSFSRRARVPPTKTRVYPMARMRRAARRDRAPEAQ